MAEKLSRRKLLCKGTQALVAGGVSAYGASAAKELAAEAAPPSMPKGVDYYEKLGVSTFINAAGTYTVLTASTMPQEVQAAVAFAARARTTEWHCFPDSGRRRHVGSVAHRAGSLDPCGLDRARHDRRIRDLSVDRPRPPIL